MAKQQSERAQLAREFSRRVAFKPAIVEAWMQHVGIGTLLDIRNRYRAIYDAHGKDAETCAMADEIWAFAMGPVSTELTPIGEQYVIPGGEKHERPKGSQLKLWEG